MTKAERDRALHTSPVHTAEHVRREPGVSWAQDDIGMGTRPETFRVLSCG